MAMLDGKVAVITGAGRGQGRSHAVALARQGASIAVCDIDAQYSWVPYDMTENRDLEETASLVRSLGGKCLAMTADVRDPRQVESFIQSTTEEFGHIDILSASAGVWAPAQIVDTSDEIWRDTIDTNLSGVFHAIRAVAPHMVRQQGGRIVATSSMCGRRGTPNLAAYTASKWGIITVNAICPSYVDTPMINFDSYNRMFRPDLEYPTRETSEEIVRTQHALPIASLPAEDVSAALLYLVSDGARYVSGTALDITAGMSAQWSA
jgi:NAD(P)-dependent dehydrogenase (short-subunit alcohol dehydrogenase family)